MFFISKEKGKVLSISDKSIIELLQENNPELLNSTLDEIVKEMEQETEGMYFVPSKAKEFNSLCTKLREIISPLEGAVITITPTEQKCLRHYIDINIPDGTTMETETFKQFLECLTHFNYCQWEIEDDEITLGLSFEGIYQK